MSEDGVIALVWRSEETRTTKNNMEVIVIGTKDKELVGRNE